MLVAEEHHGKLDVRYGEGLGGGHVLPETGRAVEHVPYDGSQQLRHSRGGHQRYQNWVGKVHLPSS